jgi:hypothetical protein
MEELISKKVKHELREFLSECGTLTKIGNLFVAYEFEHIQLPANTLPAGQRRGLVECFYAGIKWTDPDNIQSFIYLCEDALVELGGDDYRTTGAGLIRALERDGYQIANDRITRKNQSSPNITIPKTGLDVQHMNVYISRIESSLATDPALAIGTAKELIESTLKTILDGADIEYETRSEDIPSLLKKVQKALNLAPDDIDNAKRGSELIKRILSNLGAIATGIAELRNLYGTGHGSRPKSKGLEVRHARLVVTSSAALCEFLLSTYQARNLKP